jgi:hypothetical protein
MFSRIVVSLTKPPQTIRFAKDSWIKVVGHLLSVPLFLLLPLMLSAFAAPGMPQNRYERMINAIEASFRTEGAVIENGRLTSTAAMTASFDHFLLVMGDPPETLSQILIIFDETEVKVVMSNVVIESQRYEDMGLSSHDFSDMTPDVVRTLALSVRTLIESMPVLTALDWMIVYMAGLIDFILMVMFMAIVLMLFTGSTPFLFKVRVKLSVYLTTIYIFSQMILILFGFTGLETISVLIVYVWHVWAYRSFSRLGKEAVL